MPWPHGPFKSQAQRSLFWAAKRNPEIARKRGLSRTVVNEFTAGDRSAARRGALRKLPKKVKQ